MKRLILAAVAFFSLVAPSAAQQLTLEISNGRVNLDATGVPVRQILAEWGRVGGTRVVGADKIAGAPLTIKLVDLPERQALDIILRSVAGYMAAPRPASAQPGASTYDRIVILATTSAPAAARANTAPQPVAGGPRTPGRPPGMGFGEPVAETHEAPVIQPPAMPADPADTGMMNQPVFTFPNPGDPNAQIFQPVQGGATPFGTPVPPNGAPGMIGMQPNPNGGPAIYNFMPTNANNGAPGQIAPGFTVIGSSAPGMIQQPQPGQPGWQPGIPGQPGQPVKPPPK